MKLAFVLAMLLAAWSAWAAGSGDLPDPMRPAVTERVAPPSEGEATETVGQTLQSVILRKGRRPAAIINGQIVELGGEMAGAKVTAISESEVVLQGPGGKEVLKLTPAVNKQPVMEKRVVGKTKAVRDKGAL